MVYPEAKPARRRRIATDVLALLWIGVAILAGLGAHGAVLGLQAFTDGIRDFGHTLDTQLDGFTGAVQGLPAVGSPLAHAVTALRHGSGDHLIAAGTAASARIGTVATEIGIAAGLVLALPVEGAYAVWRLREARERAAALRLIQAAAAGGHLATAEMVLAWRALARARLRDLVAASPDPAGDLASGHHRALAALTLARLGLRESSLDPPARR